MADRIRVYLLDDHDVVREGLRFLLERTEDIEVVGESATAAEATTRIPACVRMSPSSTPGSRTAPGSRCAAPCGQWTPRSRHSS